MASWKPWTLTNKGQQFQAKVNAGPVSYTHLAMLEQERRKLEAMLQRITDQQRRLSYG